MTILTYIGLIIVSPLAAFALIVLFTNRRKALSHWLALAGAGIAWLASMLVFIQAIQVDNLAEQPFTYTFDWLPTGRHLAADRGIN